MKVIFLDIDGVLNSENMLNRLDDEHRALGSHDPCECYAIKRMMDLPLVQRLNQIIAATGAKVVISSSWRLFVGAEAVAEILVARGFIGEVIGQTPDLVNDAAWLEAWRSREEAPFEYERMQRGWEIREWLHSNPGVESFAVLDDCSDMDGVKHRLVLCDPLTGLDDPDVERAKWMLSQAVQP